MPKVLTGGSISVSCVCNRMMRLACRHVTHFKDDFLKQIHHTASVLQDAYEIVDERFLVNEKPK